MPGTPLIVKRGAFDEDIASTVSTNFTNQDTIVFTINNASFGFAGFGTAIYVTPRQPPRREPTPSAFTE